jgi:hypothetical protein
MTKRSKSLLIAAGFAALALIIVIAFEVRRLTSRVKFMDEQDSFG